MIVRPYHTACDEKRGYEIRCDREGFVVDVTYDPAYTDCECVLTDEEETEMEHKAVEEMAYAEPDYPYDD